jgi:hypothetical protein
MARVWDGNRTDSVDREGDSSHSFASNCIRRRRIRHVFDLRGAAASTSLGAPGHRTKRVLDGPTPQVEQEPPPVLSGYCLTETRVASQT